MKAKITAIVDMTSLDLDALVKLLTEHSAKVEFERITEKRTKRSPRMMPVSQPLTLTTTKQNLTPQQELAYAELRQKYNGDVFSRADATKLLRKSSIPASSISSVVSRLIQVGAIKGVSQ